MGNPNMTKAIAGLWSRWEANSLDHLIDTIMGMPPGRIRVRRPQACFSVVARTDYSSKIAIQFLKWLEANSAKESRWLPDDIRNGQD